MSLIKKFFGGTKKEDWEIFLEKYENNYGDKNQTIEECGITHKDFNLWYHTIKKFGVRCDEIESMRNKTIEDEIINYLREEFEKLIEQGYNLKDSIKLSGFDPITDSIKVSSSSKFKYNKPPEYWDKYKVLYNPNSKNPKERLEYEFHYREKLLKLKQSRFDRNQLKRDKRKQHINELRRKIYSNQPHIRPETLDEKIDWELEKIIKRSDKTIKQLEERIIKNRVVEEERRKSRKKKQDKYKSLVEEREELRMKRYQDIEDDKLERWKTRIENKNKRIQVQVDSQKLLEEVRKKVINQSIPDDIKDKVRTSNQYGTKFYDVDNKVVFQYCPGCDEYYDRTHFHRKGDKDLNQYCISCTRTRKGLDSDGGRRGSVYKGEKIKKYNKNGNETHRKCTSCKKFKPTNDFRYKYRGTNVCRDCYVHLPNNHLTRPNEFVDGVQMRWYDDKTFEVTHKRCNFCDKKKPRNEFTMVTKNQDGISGRCKECDKWIREYNKKTTT